MRGDKKKQREHREASGLIDASLAAAWPLGKTEKLLCSSQCNGGKLGRNINHSTFHRSDIWSVFFLKNSIIRCIEGMQEDQPCFLFIMCDCRLPCSTLRPRVGF